MIILSNCLTETVDEGCLKLANSIIKRIKQKNKDTTIISYQKESPLSDIHLNINKLMLSRELFRIIREKDEDVLYVPFSARQNFSAIRIFILSLFIRKKVYAVTTLNRPYNLLGRIMLRLSSAQIITFSKEAEKAHADIVSPKRVTYLRTGVDVSKFLPVSSEESRNLKLRYGFDPDKKLVLHVGHIKQGRNVSQLMKISSEYQVLLVSSTATKNEEDTELRKALSECPNIRIIDTYIPDIEEIYQLADVYFFPVNQIANCIDVPLSCMEAASCNKPVVTTDYAEMKEFIGAEGFYYIESFDSDYLNDILDKAVANGGNSRQQVLQYDWNNAVEYLIRTVK